VLFIAVLLDLSMHLSFPGGASQVIQAFQVGGQAR
jgi:hypothetical protein